LRQPLCGRADYGKPVRTFRDSGALLRYSMLQSTFMSTNAEVKLGAREYQPLMADFRIDGLQFD
jgi:hypothetical protein